MILNKNIINAEYLTDCAKIAATFTNAARKIPYFKLSASVQGAFLTLITGFEVALFVEVFSFADEGNDSFLSTIFLSLTGLVVMTCVHIVTIVFRDSPVVKFIRILVFCSLPLYIWGAGFIFSAGVFDALLSIFEGGDLEAELPPLPAWVQEHLIPNSIVLLVAGLSGFSSICIFSANYLFEWLKNNVEKIMTLSSDCVTAKRHLSTVITSQKQHVMLYSKSQRIAERLGKLATENAYKIAMKVGAAVSVIEGLIMQRELFLNDEIPTDEIDEFAAFFNSDSHETKTIKKMPLPVLKNYRDKLKSQDEKAILDIIND